MWASQQPVIWEPVEQQTPGGATQPDESLWVRNPTKDDGTAACAWDSDDRLLAALGAGALLRPGETATATFCVFADWTTHGVALRVSTPGLIGTLTLEGYASVTVPGGQTGCITSPDYVYGDPLPAIEDSNGGHAELVTFTFSVTNPTDRRIRDAFAEAGAFLAGFSFVAAPWCPYPWFREWTPLYGPSADPQVWSWVG